MSTSARDRALAAAREAVGHPRRRRRLRVRRRATTRPEKRPHRSGASIVHRQRRVVVDRRPAANVGGLQRRAGERRDLAGDAVDAQAVAEVRRELEREDVSSSAQRARARRRRPARRRRGRAGRRGRRRARARAPSTACRGSRRRASCRPRCGTARSRLRSPAAARRRPARTAPSCRRARSARRRRSSSGSPAPTSTWQTRSRSAFGMRRRPSSTSPTTTPSNGGATGRSVLDLEAGHRQPLARARAVVERRIAELAQPGFGELHGESAQANWRRKRRSFSKNRRRSSTP